MDKTLYEHFCNQRIVICGASGLLGLAWSSYLYQKGLKNVILLSHRRDFRSSPYKTFQYAYYGDYSLKSILLKLKPNIIINCIGLASVEKSESNPDLAFFLNATIPNTISAVSSQIGAKILHVSTDHLFTGNKFIYSETDLTSPVNIYGQSKLIGENNVLGSNPSALILRTNFYGWGGLSNYSFLDKIFSRLSAGKSIGLFHDAFFSPVSFTFLFDAAAWLIVSGSSGVYNISSSSLTKYQFGLYIAEYLSLDSSLVCPTELSSRSDLVTRPLNLRLSPAKLIEAEFPFSSVKEQLAAEIDNKNKQILSYKNFSFF